jgi:peptidyl-dipeptidase Dcp
MVFPIDKTFLTSLSATALSYGPPAFTDAGGPYDKAVAERLVKNVFSIGNTIDPEVGYRQFRGRNPETDALMKKRGFPTKSKKM